MCNTGKRDGTRSLKVKTTSHHFQVTVAAISFVKLTCSGALRHANFRSKCLRVIQIKLALSCNDHHPRQSLYPS